MVHDLHYKFMEIWILVFAKVHPFLWSQVDGWKKWWTIWESFYEISWLVVSTPLKNMKVSWDDYSQYMEIHKIHVSNHQPVMEKWKVFMKIQYHLAI